MHTTHINAVALFGFSVAKQVQTYIYMTVKQHAYQDVAETVQYPQSIYDSH